MHQSKSITLDPGVWERWIHSPYPLRVRGRVQHYPWGHIDVIPKLLGQANPRREPFAELWLGSHPELPAYAEIGGGEIALNRLTAAAGPILLGAETFEDFGGELPFLMKILSARKPLSIQVHPNKEQAQSGFMRENCQGLGLQDFRRNYRDKNHKPELIAALGDFYALRGFRPPQEVSRKLRTLPELNDLVPNGTLSCDALLELYVELMRLPQREVNLRLIPLIQRLGTADRYRRFGKADPEYWAIRADAEFSRGSEKDRGLFSLFLLNLVHLRPGQGMYLPSGEPHAYLEGTGVEIMASSNNVLRGGFTTKRVDVEELLSAISFECAKPEVLELKRDRRWGKRARYVTPASEFELGRVELSPGESEVVPRARGVEIGIVLEGKVEIERHGMSSLVLERGQSFLTPCQTGYVMSARRRSTVFVGNTPTRALRPG